MTRMRCRPLLFRPPWRIPFVALLSAALAMLVYMVWEPGAKITDGRHDRARNGIWLGHAWLGDDEWFRGRTKEPGAEFYRSDEAIAALIGRLKEHGITDIFPHLCPAQSNGEIAAVNHAQTERFLDHAAGLRIMPWIGGVLDRSARIYDPLWRKRFCESAAELLRAHPRFAGVHVNVEPCPSGEDAFLQLLEELRAHLEPRTILSVAAYPPPTAWQRSTEVHWDESYFRNVARHADQMVVMMYDTGIRMKKPYVFLMAQWTREVLTWSEGREVLLGLPAYDDAEVEWHDPDVENLVTALAGMHAGLLSEVPPNYAGVAIYSEWEMSSEEWLYLRQHFLKSN